MSKPPVNETEPPPPRRGNPRASTRDSPQHAENIWNMPGAHSQTFDWSKVAN
jgi:hypothetical protein